MKRRLALAGLLFLFVVACGSSEYETVRGIVVEVEGGLTEIDGFLVRLDDGSQVRFEPAEGLMFDGNAPLGHIRDHLRSGESVEVQYEVLPDGRRIAHAVGD